MVGNEEWLFVEDDVVMVEVFSCKGVDFVERGWKSLEEVVLE